MNEQVTLPKEILERYIHAEKEWTSMINFIRESTKDVHDISAEPPKYLRKRYGLFNSEFRTVGIAWYLLDEYFKGNITIKKDELRPE